jgi:hypothetical protein
MQACDMVTSADVQFVIRTALGEELVHVNEDDRYHTDLRELTSRSFTVEEDMLVWNRLMFEFAASILINMATALSSEFGNQTVELFGTRVPQRTFGEVAER